MSGETRKAIEAEVNALVNTAYARAKKILQTHETELHVLAKVTARQRGGAALPCRGIHSASRP